MVVIGFILAALTVRHIARRPRVRTDAGSRAFEDVVRRRTAITVSAAYGVLVAGPLTGIGLLCGRLLLDSCGPTIPKAVTRPRKRGKVSRERRASVPIPSRYSECGDV